MLPPSDDSIALPVIEEQLELHTEAQEVGAVRVRVASSTRVETIDTPLIRHGVIIERIERNEPVSEVRAPWHEGDVLVVPLYQERLVKQLVLTEEVRMKPSTDVQRERTSVELTSQTPIIERREAEGSWTEVPYPGTDTSTS